MSGELWLTLDRGLLLGRARDRDARFGRSLFDWNAPGRRRLREMTRLGRRGLVRSRRRR